MSKFKNFVSAVKSLPKLAWLSLWVSFLSLYTLVGTIVSMFYGIFFIIIGIPIGIACGITLIYVIKRFVEYIKGEKIVL